MRSVLRLTGSLLIASGLALALGSLVILAFGPPDGWLEGAADAAVPVEFPSAAAEVNPGEGQAPAVESGIAPTPGAATQAPTPGGWQPGRMEGVASTASAPLPAVAPPGTIPVPAPPALRATAAPAPFLPITRVSIPRIRLEADVVPAKLVRQDGRVMWEVPAFRAGHAEATAGAGGLGNAVLLGHVTSRNAGNVFKDLDGVRAGDLVHVFSGPQQFNYRVVEVREASRTDVSVMQPTETASLSLITCTGTWLPPLRDYAQRLVVRAELVGAVPGAAPDATSQPSPTLRTVLDERFADNRRGWPDDPQATAAFADGAYRLRARQPGRFVAVTGMFRKVGGPPGGGYGLIVRDRGPGPRDGLYQGGQYYVLEVGDRGELGICRREGDHWVDLLPWTPSAAVRPGLAANELAVRAVGQRLTFFVNGVEVASRADPVLPDGGVGIFVGGDLNEVVAEHFAVQLPT